MNFFAYYTYQKGNIQPGEKAIIYSGEIKELVNISQDMGKLIITDSFGHIITAPTEAKIQRVNFSLCTFSDLKAGDLVYEFDPRKAPRKIKKIANDNVYFTSGKIKEVPIGQVFKKVAEISHHVSFIKPLEKITSDCVKFLVCNNNSGTTRKYNAEVNSQIDNAKEYLIALIKCNNCGSFR
ncbi:hypothetical protein SAMN05428988_3262 [Chitinophaga sp. YR573]|uniref:hypothetical protein n=1 Tax=Chitinophaga sp. YR573 TaxID=1881040 RepID=UPI0008B62386|nr:hypothetical protein [Chitinophaga sp. YR573]SEW21901.1 hypothetical protein SAMN05428988_3262 [Chitinophaga sp. YR573]